MNPGPAGYGGLLRDSFGNWIQGFIGDIGRSGHSQGRIDGDSGRPEVGMGDAFR